MILNDSQIRKLGFEGMLDPFEPGAVREGVISWGVSSFGYDMRIGHDFRIFSHNPFTSSCVDPKKFEPLLLKAINTSDYVLIPPNSYALGVSVERFKVPDDVMCLVVGKSTYARCGIIVNVTPLEPGWEGFVTIEVSNSTPLPAKIYAGEGIAQVLFFRGERPETTYGDKKGKYQDQEVLTLPMVEGLDDKEETS